MNDIIKSEMMQVGVPAILQIAVLRFIVKIYTIIELKKRPIGLNDLIWTNYKNSFLASLIQFIPKTAVFLRTHFNNGTIIYVIAAAELTPSKGKKPVTNTRNASNHLNQLIIF
jgi:hypothetical protein